MGWNINHYKPKQQPFCYYEKVITLKEFVILAVSLLLSGCMERQPFVSAPSQCPPSSVSMAVENPAPLEQGPSIAETGNPTGVHPYLQSRLQEIADGIYYPGMSEYERTKAAFDYVLENMTRGESIGREMWRIHGGGDSPIPYLEQRALSPLQFGVGMCEDYAAALTLLLRELGLEAEYVPGLLYTVEGELADHAWTVVKIDGTWYHLDSHLEDYISRGRTVRYRYFLHGDATFSLTHVWGQRLMDRGLLTPEQNQEIREHYIPETCPRDYPSVPQPQALHEAPAPDIASLTAQIEKEFSAYEQANGTLPPMELDIIPPVFGLEGYGPAD